LKFDDYWSDDLKGNTAEWIKKWLRPGGLFDGVMEVEFRWSVRELGLTRVRRRTWERERLERDVQEAIEVGVEWLEKVFGMGREVPKLSITWSSRVNE